MKKSFFLLLATSFLSTLATGFFWTGFPVFLNDFGNSNLDLSTIYSFATFGSLAFGIVGGVWSDIGNCKKISIVSQLISALSIFLLAIFWKSLNPNLIMLLLPLLYFNFAISSISELVWILNFDPEKKMQNKILDRALISFLAKLSGFSLGPILFNALGINGLFLCGAIFAVVALIQFGINGAAIKLKSPGIRYSLQAIFNLVKSPAFVIASLLTGLLSIPINPIFLTRLLKIGDASDVSWFWGLAGAAGILNLILQRAGLIKFSRPKLIWVTCLLVICLILSFVSGDRIGLLVFSSLFVFGSVFFSMQLYMHVGSEAVKNSLGSSFGLLSLLMDAGVFAGMILGAAMKNQSHWNLIALLVGFCVLRMIATLKIPAQA